MKTYVREERRETAIYGYKKHQESKERNERIHRIKRERKKLAKEEDSATLEDF